MPADKRLNDPALAIHASVADDDIFYMVKDPTGAATHGSVAGSVIDSYITSNLSDNYQPLDAGLTSISGLVTAANKMIYTTALDTYAVADLTAFARTILDDANEAAFKETVNLEIGTDVQAYDPELNALAGLTSAADKLPYFTGSGTATVTDLTSFARTLLDDTTQGAMQTTLDVDPSGTDNSTDVTLAGPLDYLTLSGQQITRNAIDLTTDITGELPVTNGGTGVTSDINTGGTLSNVAYLDQANTFSVGPQTIEGANGLDINPGSDIDADLITVGVTGTPRIWWDESLDQFSMTKGIFWNSGNDIISLSSSGTMGVRTSAQAAVLDIQDNATTESILFRILADNGGPWHFNINNETYGAGTGSAFRIAVSNAGDASIYAPSGGTPGDLIFLASAVESVRFSADGNAKFVNDVEIDGDLNHDGTNAGFYGAPPVAQPSHIVDADGTLADITTKFNQLLADLASQGLQAAS